GGRAGFAVGRRVPGGRGPAAAGAGRGLVEGGLPATASGAIGADLIRHHVTATRLARVRVDDTLHLAVYLVDPLTGSEDADTSATERPQTPTRRAGDDSDAPTPAGTRDGARREILDAIRALLTRSGASTFTVPEVIDEMARRGTGYAEATVRTMVTSHLCRNAPDHAATTYDDLERVDRGTYRLVTG
ncbi:hypothetical protein AB0G02_37885, partial [Actinosynnema sp. NPDC023658]|uniref:DUF7669 domain-containing protein n=1 Tax=Actinosynnema sp. NPDC023658 TaxID=3155465 RepID=UPI0033F9FDCA